MTTKTPEPAVAPPPGNPRFPLMDSMRAIAALSVLLTHVGFVSAATTSAAYGPYLARLGVGVTIFFLLSGFLLYRPFVSARLGERERPRIPDYARRRVLRIIPAYWLALTLLAIWPGLPQMWEPHSWVYYGIFLWNNPLASELATLDWGEWGFLGIAVSTLALSVLAASASYYLVERPILRFKEPRSRRRRTRAATVRA